MYIDETLRVAPRRCGGREFDAQRIRAKTSGSRTDTAGSRDRAKDAGKPGFRGQLCCMTREHSRIMRARTGSGKSNSREILAAQGYSALLT
ncbi:MAG: hypothetical protein ABIO49_01500 [Dokdonella sp.]